MDACVQPASSQWLLYKGSTHPCGNFEDEMWWMVRRPSAAAQLYKGHKLLTQELAVADMLHGDKSIPSCNLVSQFCHCLKRACHSCAGVWTGSCEKTAAKAHISWLSAGLTPCQSHHIFSSACLNNRLASICNLLAAVRAVELPSLNVLLCVCKDACIR